MTDIVLTRKKLIDDKSGVIHEVAYANDSQSMVGHRERRLADFARWQRSHGAITPRLLTLMDSDPSATFDVDIVAQSRDLVPGLIRDIQSNDIPFVSKHHDVIFVRANRDQLQAVAFNPDVEAITTHYPRENLSIDAAKDVGQANLAVSHQVGVGVGFLSVVWEKGACVFREHSDFALIDWQPRTPSTCSDVMGGHSTRVAGVLGAFRATGETSGLFRGKMTDVDSDNDVAEDRMWELSPQIVNASFTTSPSDGQRIDEAAYESGVLVFIGAGNDSDDEANCYAYNALCVGAYNHAGTIGAYGDDVRWLGQSFKNDDDTGREGPHIVGPVSVTSATRGGGYGSDRGTSYATPAIAGLGGLLLTHQPFLLWQKPALMRAILMASAQSHPISNVSPSVPNFADGIDDTSGVGAPDGDRAMQIVDEKSFHFEVLTPADLGVVASFAVEPQRRYRVVLAWDQCPTYSPYGHPEPNELKVDLDMAVRLSTGHSGGSVSISLGTVANPSFVDNWEAVEFTTLVGGNADIVLSAPRFGTCALDDGRTEVRTAIAWTSQVDNSTGTVSDF